MKRDDSPSFSSSSSLRLHPFFFSFTLRRFFSGLDETEERPCVLSEDKDEFWKNFCDSSSPKAQTYQKKGPEIPSGQLQQS